MDKIFLVLQTLKHLIVESHKLTSKNNLIEYFVFLN